jgi:hypothetical protein
MLTQKQIDEIVNASREAEEGPTAFARRVEAVVIAAERERCAKCVPTNWLDPLLTGNNRALPKSGDTITNRHIEALLRGVQDRIRAANYK